MRADEQRLSCGEIPRRAAHPQSPSPVLRSSATNTTELAQTRLFDTLPVYRGRPITRRSTPGGRCPDNAGHRLAACRSLLRRRP